MEDDLVWGSTSPELATPWDWNLGWNLGSVALFEDLALALACGAIVTGLLVLLGRRRDHSGSRLFWWFTTLFAVLGIENLLEALVHFAPVESWLAGVRLLVVVLCWTAVLALARTLPGTLSERSRSQLEGEITRLLDSEAELSERNQSLARGVAESHRSLEDQNRQLTFYTRELEKRNADLVRSNQELDDFAYVASHDLKEPLRGIHNYATFLTEDYRERLDAEGREKLATLTRLSQRMEQLIDSLLQFSRVGRVDLAIEATNMNDLVKDVLLSLSIMLTEHQTIVRIPDLLPTVCCDRVRIREVFLNLITNGIKYNDKPERWIEIGWKERRGTDDSAPPEAVYYVRDNGIGIKDKHFESVFGIFKRLHGRDKFGGGTGAGLTIVKKIVERHGGRIWVESAFGEGTTFCFTLGSARQAAGEA